MGRKFARIVVVVALVFFAMPAALAGAQNTPEAAITITTPKEGDSIVNTAAAISGTSPPSTIVRVVITDTDTSRSGVAHQEDGKVEGTVTAGSDGNWTYVPQHTLVPGPFSVQASYTNDQNQVIDSKSVGFVALDSGGSSVQVSDSLIKRLTIWGGLLIILIILIVLLTIRRRRLKNITTDAHMIEEELEHTMEQLVRTNAEIAELNEKIEKQQKPPGGTTTGAPKSG